jgi:hypothetical protein
MTPKLIVDGKEGGVDYSNQEFLLRVARGLEPRFSFVEKFGENPDVDTGAAEDVWGYGGEYTYSTTADIDTISSSDVTDTQNIVVIGQTADYTELEQTATLDGQNKVVLATPLRRVYRMYNDGSTDIAGTVYCYVDDTVTGGVPDTANKVRAVIVNGDNQTEMCIWTVPKGKRAFFLGGYVSISRAVSSGAATFTWKLRLPGKVFRVQSRIACMVTGRSAWDYPYPIPVGPLPEGTDIAITAEDVTANNTGCSGGFTILLEKTDEE